MSTTSSKEISIVVSSYGRLHCIQRLVESARRVFPEDAYEIIAVCSDLPTSDKVKWLDAQPDVVYVQADIRTTHRLKSLYAYENIGIKLALGEWVFVTNDDTEFDDNFYHSFAVCRDAADVIIVAGHIGEMSLGCRTAIIGTVTKPGCKPENLYLYDFTLIKRRVYKEIGYLDENLDWFGKGFDLAMKCETHPGLNIIISQDIKINHSIDAENRRPPHYARDFNYATKKWTEWCKQSGWSFSWPW